MPVGGAPNKLPWPVILAVAERLWTRKPHKDFVATQSVKDRHGLMMAKINACLKS